MTPYENSNRYRMHKNISRQPLLLKAWRELLKGKPIIRLPKKYKQNVINYLTKYYRLIVPNDLLNFRLIA